MKKRILIAGQTILLSLAAATAWAQDMTMYAAKSGGKMRIEGTSNVHDWQAEGTVIGGKLEVGTGFPNEPGQAVTPGKMEAKSDLFVMVRSLKSIYEDGRPYMDSMNNVMWEHLREDKNPRILYHLTALVLKEAPASKDAPYVFDTTGDLTVAGVSKTVSFPVNVVPLGDGQLKITGSTSVKMSEFKVEPPSPPGLGMVIKTGDDVKVIFTWMLAKKAPAAAAK